MCPQPVPGERMLTPPLNVSVSLPEPTFLPESFKKKDVIEILSHKKAYNACEYDWVRVGGGRWWRAKRADGRARAPLWQRLTQTARAGPQEAEALWEGAVVSVCGTGGISRGLVMLIIQALQWFWRYKQQSQEVAGHRISAVHTSPYRFRVPWQRGWC